MAATMRDIAKAAGVSKAAVSKVLHDTSSSVRVSVDRANTIRRLAEQMGYVPNQTARNLKSSRSNTIGIYFEDLAGLGSGPLYTMHLLDGVCQEVFRRHYRVALLAELDDQNTMHALRDGRLDGVIWCRLVRDQRTFRFLENCPIPIVTMTEAGRQLAGPNLVSVRCDNAGGIEGAVEHLWNLGHRRIMFLHELREADASDCVDRLEAFKRSMADRGAPVEAEDVASWSWELDEFGDWWRSNPPHTAILAWSERSAGRVLEQCRAHKVKAPAELSVVGFDSTQYSEQTRPRLTCVRQPIKEMASLAARSIIELIEGRPLDSHSFILPCPLDVRRSTARPR
jgi:LacI family transcriptional regulator